MAAQRVAVITGSTAGIGEATARLLAGAGYRVVLTGRRADRLSALAGELGGEGHEVLGVPGDITEDSVLTEVLAAPQRQWGQPVDVAVLCAGRGLRGTVLNSDADQWRALVEVNYLSVARQLRACATEFMTRAEAEHDQVVRDMVVIGSTTGRLVSTFNPLYGSTKFAVHSLVEALRQEVCAAGIRVTLVEPGFVKSEFQAVAGYDGEWFTSVEHDWGPLLEPEDVARTVEFVLGQPAHVHLDDIRIRPTRQRV